VLGVARSIRAEEPSSRFDPSEREERRLRRTTSREQALDRGREFGIAARIRLLRALLALQRLEQRARILRVRRGARCLAAEAQQRRHVVFPAVPRRLERSAGVAVRPSVPSSRLLLLWGLGWRRGDAGSRLGSRFRAGVGCDGRRLAVVASRAADCDGGESEPDEDGQRGQPPLRGRRRSRAQGAAHAGLAARRSRGRGAGLAARRGGQPTGREARHSLNLQIVSTRVQGTATPCPGELRSSPTRRTEQAIWTCRQRSSSGERPTPPFDFARGAGHPRAGGRHRRLTHRQPPGRDGHTRPAQEARHADKGPSRGLIAPAIPLAYAGD
jgi:hypothetical protein